MYLEPELTDLFLTEVLGTLYILSLSWVENSPELVLPEVAVVILRCLGGPPRRRHRARHSTTLQCMRLTDYVILNFNNKMITAAVFLDIEKAFHRTWHSGLLFMLCNLKFSNSLAKLIGPFFHKVSSDFLWKVKCPRQEKCKQGCAKVLSCPQLFLTCI
jgi:hypothetical protein